VPYEEGLDLSRMRITLTGGERVLWQTLLDFQETAGPLGFPWSSIIPSYGMAEGVVGTTHSPVGRGPIRGPGGYVSVGVPLAGTRVRVASGTEASPVHVAGESLFAGYQTADGFQPQDQEWYDTGDAGFVHDGELYVLGRRDEIISLGGRNLFAEDAEAVAHDVGGDSVRACAVFRDPEVGDRFAMFVEVDRALAGSLDAALEFAKEIRASVTQTLGTRLTSVWVLRRGSIPRTTSGKLQRSKCRALYGTDKLARKTVAELT
jgi:fatty-acyl-CoA synthase